ncbi:unnamed protein product [Lota lota]
MSRAGRTCPQCGSSSVVEDELYSESQLVCQDCGFVVSNGCLVTDTREGTADVRYSHSTAVSKVPCRNQIKGLQRVRALCRILRLNYEVEELAEVYYRKAYSHARFIRVSLQKKEALVGCCVLVSCRLRNWPITLGTISGLLETDPTLVGGVYQELENILDVEIPKTSITQVLEAHSREYKLSSTHVSKELAESSEDLAKRSVALVELAADTWIVTGRHPVPIMMASIFLSWQSLKPTKTRLRYSLNKFCRLSKMPFNKTAMQRVGEMKEVLCKLGQEIPWLSVGGGASPDDVMLHVEDILQHRHALLRGALRTHEESLRAQEESLGPQEDSLGAQEESLGPQEESLGAQKESPGPQEERLGPQDESLGPQEESLGAQEESSGPQEERLGAQEESSGPQEESLGPQDESLGPQEESLGAQEESSGPQEERLGAQEESSGPQEESPGTQEERLGAQEKSLGTQEERLGTHTETLGTGVQPSTEDPRLRAPSQAPDMMEQPPEPCALKAVDGDPEEGGGETHGIHEQRPAVHWGKRILFVPPCVRHAKIRRAGTAERADVNGDEEISDSEIDSYIRSPQEVKDYLQTQHLLLSASEDGQSRRVKDVFGNVV